MVSSSGVVCHPLLLVRGLTSAPVRTERASRTTVLSMSIVSKSENRLKIKIQSGSLYTVYDLKEVMLVVYKGVKRELQSSTFTLIINRGCT